MIRGVAFVITLSSCAFETAMPGDDDLPPGQDPVGGVEEDHVPGLGEEQRLTNDPSFGASSFGNARTVIANGNTLHVIWFDERSKTGLEPDFENDPNCFKCTRSAREIYTRRSLDRGRTWEPVIRLTQSAGTSEFPAIAASGRFVHAVWTDNRDGNTEIYYKSSGDNGQTWGADVRLTAVAGTAANPSIAASGSFVHVVWQDRRDNITDIYYRRSTENGVAFDAERRLSTTAAASLLPSVGASGADVHVAWEEHRDGNGEIYHARSTDNGAAWTAQRVTTTGAHSFAPSLSVTGGRVNISWHEGTGVIGVVHARSEDRGASWSAPARVTIPGAIASWAQITSSPSETVIAWTDERHGGRNLEIYLTHSIDGGATWSAESRISFDENRSNDPGVAIIGRTGYVLWTDARDGFTTGDYSGNYEMYFRPIGF